LTKPKADLLQGTLDMLILKALEPRAAPRLRRHPQLIAEEESWDRLALAIAKIRKAV
jgi:hypothetical protein